MANKNQTRHDDMRNPRNKQQYRNIDNRNALRSLTDTSNTQQNTSDASKKKEGEKDG
jgi:hypothetical protein